MLYTLHFFSSKCSLFHNANFFGSCIIHILYTGVLKLKKNNSGAKGLIRKRQDFRTKKKLLNMKCVSIFSTTFASYIFILRRTERDMVENVYWSSCKAPFILTQF